MNCRTHEHRHFERILRIRACLVSTFGSGSVKDTSGCVPALGRRLIRRGLKVCLVECLNRDSWDSFPGSVSGVTG